MRRNLFLISTAVVLLVALFARFFRLSEYPVSLSMDEIAVGYDSYSISKTGKDQFGKILPLVFKSVGDFKTPVVFYLVASSIDVLG